MKSEGTWTEYSTGVILGTHIHFATTSWLILNSQHPESHAHRMQEEPYKHFLLGELYAEKHKPITVNYMKLLMLPAAEKSGYHLTVGDGGWGLMCCR